MLDAEAPLSNPRELMAFCLAKDFIFCLLASEISRLLYHFSYKWYNLVRMSTLEVKVVSRQREWPFQILRLCKRDTKVAGINREFDLWQDIPTG